MAALLLQINTVPEHRSCSCAYKPGVNTVGVLLGEDSAT